MSVVIEAVNRFGRMAVLEDGTVCAIEMFLDADGDEVDDPEIAVVAIGRCRMGAGSAWTCGNTRR